LSSGIYLITNTLNGKLYIGQSKNIPERWKSHKSTAHNKKQKTYKYQLYREIRLYGIGAFKFSILEECGVSILDQREIFWISKYNTFLNPSHYNKTAGGKNVSPKFKRKRRKKRRAR